ncbi:MAG: hypothetical protein P1T08_14065 [Acidimicrobiia bacterium]|nr:hypothetical protein [Acidimicrobiia bacterium]
MELGTLTIEFGTLTLRTDGILHVVFDFDGEATKEAAVEYLEARAELGVSPPPPVLLEIVQIPYVERSIRSFFMDGLPTPPCRAVVASDDAFLTMYRTFQLVEPTAVPTEVFPTVEAAVAWIHEQTSLLA